MVGLFNYSAFCIHQFHWPQKLRDAIATLSDRGSVKTSNLFHDQTYFRSLWKTVRSSRLLHLHIRYQIALPK